MADFGVRITLAASSPVPTYSGGIWSLGIAKLSSGHAPGSGWTTGDLIACSPLGERADLAGGGNYVETSEASIVIESTHWPAFDTAGASIYSALVEVGTLSGPTLSVVWSGIVSDCQWSGPSLALTVESIASRRHREIPRLAVTSDDLDGLVVDPAGTPIPIIYGVGERMTPVHLQASRALSGVLLRSGSEETELFTTGVYPSGVNTVEFISIVAARNTTTLSASFAGTWYESLLAGSPVYVDVIAGTGSGQRRQLIDTGVTYQQDWNGVRTFAAKCELSVDLVTALDVTSVLRIDVIDRLVDLGIADEATVSRIYTDDGANEFDLAFVQSEDQGFTTVDASSEFFDGESFVSSITVRGAETWGVNEIVDGISKSGLTVNSPGSCETAGASIQYEAFCRSRVMWDQIPKSAIDANATCKACFSIDMSSLPDASVLDPGTVTYYVCAYVFDFYGTRHDIRGEPKLDSTDEPFTGDGNTCNAFGGFNSSDGDPGNYTLKSIALPIPIPLSEVHSITFALLSVGNAPPPGRDFSADTTGASGTVTVVVNNFIGFSIGDWIRQQSSADLDFGMPAIYSSQETIFKSGAWRQITNVSGSTLTVSDSDSWESASGLSFLHILDSEMQSVIEREAAITFEFGDVSADADFLTDATGRKYSSAIWPTLSGVIDPPNDPVANVTSGDTINAARSAALDILYRDLELGASEVDQASFLALATDAIACVLPEKRSSRDVLAQMAMEFGWVIAHDHQGREVATDLLGSVGAETFALEIQNAEIISGSIEGLQATSIEDVLTIPQIFGRWTQADGFRLSYGIKDLSIDPGALTSGNFKDHVFGFAEFDASVTSFYRFFHDGKALSGVENSGSIEIKMHDGRYGYDMMVDRFAWVSRRKPVLTLLVLEDHAAMTSHVGQRVKITHRRYAPAGLFGVLAAKYWYPEQGNISLTVMLDPAAIGGSETEGGWNFNWGNDWGEYT